MMASAFIAAVIPANAEKRQANDGTLRVFSVTIAGTDQDAPMIVISCIFDSDTIYSCSVTVVTGTTTGGENTSRDPNGR